MKRFISVLSSLTSFLISPFARILAVEPVEKIQVSETALGFRIPNFADILTFLIRFFFVAAGLAALLYLLLGAFAWITSGGSKENVDKARDKIQAAVVGVILIVAVLAIVVLFERVIFNQAICFGLTCPLSVPALLEKR